MCAQIQCCYVIKQATFDRHSDRRQQLVVRSQRLVARGSQVAVFGFLYTSSGKLTR